MIGSPTFLDDLKKTETCPPEAAKVARGLMEPLSEDMLAKNYKAIVGLYKWVSAVATLNVKITLNVKKFTLRVDF